MKIEITRKQMTQLPHLYRVGYCEAQSLLEGLEPVAYTAGIYGWSCDVYALPGGAHICTGYRGLAGDSIPDISQWESAARSIISAHDWQEDRWAKLDALRRDLVGTLLAREVQA